MTPAESLGGDVAEPAAARGSLGRVALWIAAIVLVTAVVRVPTFRLPLDQDGSVFCTCALTWSEGGLPYRDAWDHKPPLTYLAYRALFAVAPPSSVSVNATLRVGSMLCDALTAVLLLLLGRRLFGLGAGVAAGLVFGVFTGAAVLQLESFQPERLTVLFTVAGVLAGVAYADSRRYWQAALCGLLFGLALIAKQIAAPVGVAMWAWLTWDALRGEGRKALPRVVVHSVLLAVGALLPWGLCVAYFAGQGAFAEFWECTFTFNLFYASEHRKGSLLAGVVRLVKTMGFDHASLWLAGAGGMVAALAARSLRRGGVLVLLWVGAAFLALVLPGQYAFYYYIPSVGALALGCGLALVGLWRVARRPGALRAVAAASMVVLLGLAAFAAKRSYGFLKLRTRADATDVVVAKLADYIASETQPGDRIYMRGGRMQVYVLSGRRNVCPYMYDFYYGLPPEEAYHYKPEKLAAIMAALEEHKPPFIVVVDATYEKLEEYFPAFRRYLAAHYAPDAGKPVWAAKPYSLMVYRRKGEG